MVTYVYMIKTDLFRIEISNDMGIIYNIITNEKLSVVSVPTVHKIADKVKENNDNELSNLFISKFAFCSTPYENNRGY